MVINLTFKYEIKMKNFSRKYEGQIYIHIVISQITIEKNQYNISNFWKKNIYIYGSQLKSAYGSNQ